MYYSARNLFNRKVNFATIVKEAVGDAQLIRAIAYTISTKGGEEEPFFEALRNNGIEVKSKELQEFNSGVKKGDWDVGITVDIIRMLDMLDVIVIVSGDGDYIPLVHFIQSRGRIVQVASFRETTSSNLVSACDEYLNLSENKRKFLIMDRQGHIKKNEKSAPAPTDKINPFIPKAGEFDHSSAFSDKQIDDLGII
jgi:uncharacterized LabA/DUF88 family protein